jgi:hypothetical protein
MVKYIRIWHLGENMVGWYHNEPFEGMVKELKLAK